MLTSFLLLLACCESQGIVVMCAFWGEAADFLALLLLKAIHRFFPTWTFPFSPVWRRLLFKIRTRDEIRFAFVTTFLSSLRLAFASSFHFARKTRAGGAVQESMVTRGSGCIDGERGSGR
jgi:hypothetical protein